MIINREQLIQLLVKKTGLEKEQVQGQLSKLIKRINEAAEQGKSFEVEGFGTFSVDDGDLHFTPEDRLETEINNKYAGMKPIELIGAFRGSDEEIPEMKGVSEKPDRESWSFDEEAADIRKAGEIEAGAKASESTEDSEAIKVEEGEKKETVETDEAEPVAKEKTEMKSEDRSEEGVKEPAKEKPKEKASKRETEDRDVIGKILVAAVVLIFLGVAGFFVYDMGLLDNSSGSSSVSANSEITQTEPQPAQQPEVTTGVSEEEQADQKPIQGTEEANKITQEEQSQPDQPKEIPDPEPEQQAELGSPYGLRGEVNESIDGGYMIVVHSLRNREQARTNRQALADEGFRALITRAVIDNSLYFRVGIGQFKSVADAQEAIKEIPEEYRKSYFIKRIQ